MTKITFIETNHTVDVRIGTELLDMYKRNPLLPLRFGCTRGDCGICAIDVIEGGEQLSPKTKKEIETLAQKQKKGNCRLACQCAVAGPKNIVIRSVDLVN